MPLSGAEPGAESEPAGPRLQPPACAPRPLCAPRLFCVLRLRAGLPRPSSWRPPLRSVPRRTCAVPRQQRPVASLQPFSWCRPRPQYVFPRPLCAAPQRLPRAAPAQPSFSRPTRPPPACPRRPCVEPQRGLPAAPPPPSFWRRLPLSPVCPRPPCAVSHRRWLPTVHLRPSSLRPPRLRPAFRRPLCAGHRLRGGLRLRARFRPPPYVRPRLQGVLRRSCVWTWLPRLDGALPPRGAVLAARPDCGARLPCQAAGGHQRTSVHCAAGPRPARRTVRWRQFPPRWLPGCVEL